LRVRDLYIFHVFAVERLNFLRKNDSFTIRREKQNALVETDDSHIAGSSAGSGNSESPAYAPRGIDRKLSAGLYSFLPLGFRSLKKVERIVREEMDRAGALELLMPALHPQEIWKIPAALKC